MKYYKIKENKKEFIIKEGKCNKCKYNVIIDPNFMGLAPLTNCKFNLTKKGKKEIIIRAIEDKLYCNKYKKRR